ncbi:MAG: HAD family hydrolase [Dehalococcoidia bacterium]
MLRAVIFDLGHTVWNYAPTEEMRRLHVLRLHAAIEASVGTDSLSPAALDRALGRSVGRLIKRWEEDGDIDQPPSDDLLREALASLDITPPNEVVGELTAVFFGAEHDMPVIEPDTLEPIAVLSEQGLTLGCVTNTLTLHTGIEDALRRLGMLRYVRSVVSSSAMGYRKPHASLFQRALEELDVAPEDALFVGDRLFDDVSGAHGVGMRAVLTHQYRQEPLAGARVAPVAVIRRLSELPRVIEELTRRS